MATKGKLVPIVLIPRFTSFVSVGTYSSVAIDVSGYSGGTVVAWPGPVYNSGGAAPGLLVKIQDSEDGDHWFDIDNINLDSVTSGELDFALTRRWLRASTYLHNSGMTSDPIGVTCWCTGSLESRLR